ncbi:MAG: LCP family protein [Lachnospiraceae bacterium]|nr:LCP family protein [Lachnospiraceae bacterium]MDY4970957.1 LCP family protein [Lachnospiraceae bacterium]
MDKKKNKARIVLLVVLAVLAAVWLFFSFAPSKYKSAVIKEVSTWPFVRKIVGMSVQDDYEKKVMDESFDANQVEVNQHVAKKLTGYTNIALFGLDSRDTEMNSGTHSDSIMVVSINNDTNAVRIASVYRDTMLKVTNPEGRVAYTKANQGFFRGGAEGALSMLNTNLDLDITDYVTINFSGLTEIIDSLGGLDININEEEKKYINFYLIETRKITGMECEDVTEYGDVHLNGLQATAFCRIRYTPFYDEEGNKYPDDLGRTARQRYIISKIVEKIKKSGVSSALSLAQSVMDKNAQGTPFIKSSLSYNDIMDLIPAMIDYNIEDTTGFPFTLDTPTINGESMVVAQGLSYNVQKLHEFLFDEKDYEVSQEVQDISDYIMDYTGLGEVRLKEDRLEEETAEGLSAEGEEGAAEGEAGEE